MKITLHAHAPAKPLVGTPCNGCGVCCSIAPCPPSRFLLGHRDGVCPALTWQDKRYSCGLVVAPASHLSWLPPAAEPFVRQLALRWIAAGRGCDCDAVVDDLAD